MNFRDHLEKIKYFQAICEAGTFRKAAMQLHLSQSSLTVAVKKLEENVGRSLLVRTKRGVWPTAAGDMLLAFAKDLSLKVEDLEARLRAPSEAVAGRIRISAYDSIAIYWLPQVLRHLHKKFPSVSLSVSVGPSSSSLEKVRSGDADIAVVVSPSTDRRLRMEKLFSDRFSFYATAGVQREQARSKGKTPSYLIGMFAARVSEGKNLGDVLLEKGVETSGSLDVESFEIAKALAMQGVGMAALPQRVAELATLGKRLERVKSMPSGFGQHDMYLVTADAAHSRSSLAISLCEEIKRLG